MDSPLELKLLAGTPINPRDELVTDLVFPMDLRDELVLTDPATPMVAACSRA
jgi:hypothetical protein